MPTSGGILISLKLSKDPLLGKISPEVGILKSIFQSFHQIRKQIEQIKYIYFIY